jgi:hypothetical protein
MNMQKTLGSKKHILDLSALGTVNIAVQLSRAYQESVQRHNEEAEKNLYILCKIIDCIKFCGAFELALRGHDETENSENPGIFLGLVDLVSSIDTAVKERVQSSSVFKGTSKTVQNELLEVCHEKIKAELNETKFVALMADETSNVSEHLQMAIVYRYEMDGNEQERFGGFFNPEGQSAAEMSDCISTELNSTFSGDSNKIVAQTFDGAAVMRGSVNGVQSKIKECFPLAHYVHCYAHQLNVIMERAASQNRSARVFFDISNFFLAFTSSC